MSCASLILAAGAGVRYGQPKASVILDGERLVDRAVRLSHAAGCTPVVVVLGAWIADVPDAQVVVNSDWELGMGTSLAVGVRWLAEHCQAEAVLVNLVDLPGMTADAMSAIRCADGDVVAATFDGERGHPVKFGRAHWLAVADRAHGDVGARDFLRHHRPVTLMEVGHLAIGTGLDVPAEPPMPPEALQR